MSESRECSSFSKHFVQVHFQESLPLVLFVVVVVVVVRFLGLLVLFLAPFPKKTLPNTTQADLCISCMNGGSTRAKLLAIILTAFRTAHLAAFCRIHPNICFTLACTSKSLHHCPFFVGFVWFWGARCLVFFCCLAPFMLETLQTIAQADLCTSCTCQVKLGQSNITGMKILSLTGGQAVQAQQPSHGVSNFDLAPSSSSARFATIQRPFYVSSVSPCMYTQESPAFFPGRLLFGFG